MGNENNRFPRHFKDFITELNRYEVEYMLIGGYAMGAYGHIRGTNDLDIFINATDTNAQRMMKACQNYGIPAEDLKKEMFLVQKMVGIGQPPLRIELLKKLDTIDFEYAYKRAKSIEVDGVSINVVDLEDLILLKKAAVKGREKSRDQEDLTYLEKIKAKIKQGRGKRL